MTTVSQIEIVNSDHVIATAYTQTIVFSLLNF